MKIFVTTKRNGKGLHGEILGSSFVRSVDGRHIRWSDHSFCINSKVIQRFNAPKYRFLKYVQFKWRKSDRLEIYSMSLKDFLENAEEVVNEHGEKNFRCSIDLFKLTRTQKFDPVPTYTEHLKEVSEEKIEEELQPALF